MQCDVEHGILWRLGPSKMVADVRKSVFQQARCGE